MGYILIPELQPNAVIPVLNKIKKLNYEIVDVISHTGSDKVSIIYKRQNKKIL